MQLFFSLLYFLCLCFSPFSNLLWYSFIWVEWLSNFKRFILLSFRNWLTYYFCFILVLLYLLNLLTFYSLLYLLTLLFLICSQTFLSGFFKLTFLLNSKCFSIKRGKYCFLNRRGQTLLFLLFISLFSHLIIWIIARITTYDILLLTWNFLWVRFRHFYIVAVIIVWRDIATILAWQTPFLFLSFFFRHCRSPILIFSQIWKFFIVIIRICSFLFAHFLRVKDYKSIDKWYYIPKVC